MPKPLYHRHRFPGFVISCAVRWHFRFQVSLRDIEELLFERGMVLSYETIRRWCDKFGAHFTDRVQLRSYQAAKAKMPELTGVRHVFVKAAAQFNNRAENSHLQHASGSVLASGRSGSISPLSANASVRRVIESFSPNASLRGYGLPKLPKIRPLFSDWPLHPSSVCLHLNKLTLHRNSMAASEMAQC